MSQPRFNPKHLKTLQKGVRTWNQWRKDNSSETPNLRKANLSGTDLRGADLSMADLSMAHLIQADLLGADLRAAIMHWLDLSLANLIMANLSGADLSEANLHEANLSGADLSRARLPGTNLFEADLSDANFENTSIGRTSFSHVDLSTSRNLEAVVHQGPSSVSTDTLELSKGQIPDVFLQGCGLRPWEILNAKLYNPNLTANQIAEIQNDIFQERSKGFWLGGVFISYSHVNSTFVDALYARLGKEGANVWLDREDMKVGGIQEQVARAMRLNDIVVTVLSEDSVKSDWVETELEWALQKEKDEGRNVLCPVALDDAWKAKTDPKTNTTTYTLWRKVKEKLVLDFSKWDSDPTVFEKEFVKLLDGLKINYARTG